VELSHGIRRLFEPTFVECGGFERAPWDNSGVPLPLRPTLEGAREGGASSPPALTEAERSALTVIAEHVRDRVGLQQVWIFVQVPAAGAHAAIEDVARASSGGAEIPDGAARVIALGAVRGEQRRFGRRTVAFEGGVHVVTAETPGGRVVTVVAAGPGGGRMRGEAESALVELAEIAARVLGEPAGETLAAPPSAPEPVPAAPPVREPARPAAYGGGLAEALSQLKRPPILAESRLRLARELDQRHPATSAAARTIETDAGLTLAVLAAANAVPTRPRDGYASVPDALRVLGARAVLRIAEDLPALGSSSDRLGTALARLSGHALATRAAADVLARHVGDPKVDVLRVAGMLHDVGKAALAVASGDYLTTLAAAATPEERLTRERRRLGIDHASIGAVALRRLGLPKSLVTAVERHHSTDASGPAAIVRLADMLAHEASGEPISHAALVAAGRAFRIESADLQRIAYDLARSREPRDASPEPSPLTPMQHKVLVGLSQGRTYKQIAAELSVSESTVRTHLHNLYGKLEVGDRAQAVLLAAERGWI
jgi:putative nucleotidyltransferase with HDIG domain